MEFAYKAVDARGKAKRGSIAASTRQEALASLRAQGIYATQLAERKSGRKRLRPPEGSVWNTEIRLGPKVKHREFAVFARQFATLVRAGVSLSAAIGVLAEQTENRTFSKVLAEVSRELQKGNQLSEALAQRRDIFPTVFVSMARAGEISGSLDDVLDRMATFFEKEHYTREKVKSALTYPVVVSVIAVVVTVFLLIKVVPTFVNLFASFNAQLPLPTRIVLGASRVFVHGWYWMGLALIALIAGYVAAMRKDAGRLARDTLLLRLPIFGELLKKSVMARMARTMSTLFASAVPVLPSLQLTAEVVENQVVATALGDAEQSLSSGQPMSDPFAAHWVFPPLVVQMVRVGEETGNLDFMLTKIADFYEAETEASVDRLKSLLEPLMILVLACIVGVIVMAVITPMFSLYNQVGNIE